MNKLVILSATLLISIVAFSSPAGNANPHSLEPLPDCSSCHLDEPEAKPGFSTKMMLPNPDSFKKDGVSMCTGCHEGKSGHMVGVTVDFPIPADLPLDKKNRVDCLTCHYTHGSLSSDRPQASYSFMDVLVDAERLHKSFLIRRNNANGELCLICHKLSS